MSIARKEVDPKIWDRLVESMGRNSTLSEVHCHIPICVGYSEEISEEDLRALIEEIQRQKYDWTIYLSPKDETALQNWLSTHEKLLAMYRDKITTMREWHKNPAWQAASTKYDELRAGERKEAIQKLLTNERTNFFKRNKTVPIAEIEDHIIMEVKDCVSWMQSKESGNSHRIDVLIYKNNLTQPMHNAIQNAERMGYLKDSLIHCKYVIKPILESDLNSPIILPRPVPKSPLSSTSSELLQEVVVALAAQSQRVDPKWAAQLVVNIHDLRQEKSSKYAEFARRAALEQQESAADYVLSVQLPVPADSKVLAMGEVTSDHPDEVVPYYRGPREPRDSRDYLRKGGLFPTQDTRSAASSPANEQKMEKKS